MKKEKYIIERLSGGKDSSGKVVAYVVYIPYWQNGERKNYNLSFKVSDYRTAGAAKKAAIAERDRILPVLKSLKNAEQPESYTVNELFALVPDYFPVKLGSVRKNTMVYNKHIRHISL